MREQMMKRHGRWQNLPPEHREMIEAKLRSRFQQMPDRQLEEFMINLNIWRMLPQDEREQVFKRYIDIRRHGRLPHREKRQGEHPGSPPEKPEPAQQ